jgi:hypothetical protein
MTTKEMNHLDALNQKHKVLNEQIKAYEASPAVDDIIIQKLKKEKLAVKDEITEFKRNLAKNAFSKE